MDVQTIFQAVASVVIPIVCGVIMIHIIRKMTRR